jgi:CheY-like chemotaxis protein
MLEQQGKPVNVLLVDDDDLDVENVRRAFRKASISSPLWVASDGEEALRMLRGAEYPSERRLLLLDLNLPRISGIELLREIRKDPKLQSLTVVVLTTSNEERDRADAYRLNVAGYLVKPVAFGSFVEVMAAMHQYFALNELV